MSRYTFSFLTIIGETADHRILEAANDEDAMEIARLFDHLNAVRVFEGAREVGTVPPRRRKRRTDPRHQLAL
jgi:hypothetical protein